LWLLSLYSLPSLAFFLAFFGAILIAIIEINYLSTALTEITSTNTRIWAQTDAYERISGLRLQPHKRIHVLSLIDIRVVTQDFGRKSKLEFWL
jgi:hypothetical protein